MSTERKTIFEEAPDSFVLPGQARNGEPPLEDLVFERDKSDPGVLYRAKLKPEDFGLVPRCDLDIKESSDP